MIYLRSLRMTAQEHTPEAYPFNLPLIKSLRSLTFEAPVTFFVGENGAGKSTMLEAIAGGRRRHYRRR